MKSPDKHSLPAISPETPDFPTVLMEEVREKTTTILGAAKKLPMGRKNVEIFQKDGWHIYVLKNHRGEELIFFISPVYTGDNQSIHLYKGRKLFGKMMIKLRNDTSGEKFIRDKIDRNDFETGFELPETQMILSLPLVGEYYNSARDVTIDSYLRKRREAGELFFFKTFEEYLQLQREGCMNEEWMEAKKYIIRVMYTDGSPDEYYTITGLLSCESKLPRPGKNADCSVKSILEAEGVEGWEILGIFPPPNNPENIA